jgi:hypothetical protein
VQCNFTDFDTEDSYDVLTVCDGVFCCPASVVASVSGSPQTSQVLSSALSTSLTLSFATDGVINLRGFRAVCTSTSTTPPVTQVTAGKVVICSSSRIELLLVIL